MIQVVVVLSVVFVCSGSFLYNTQLFEVDMYFDSVFLREFGWGCFVMFHDVSHRFSCFLIVSSCK